MEETMSRRAKIIVAVFAALLMVVVTSFALAGSNSCGSDSDCKGGTCSSGHCSNANEYYK